MTTETIPMTEPAGRPRAARSRPTAPGLWLTAGLAGHDRDQADRAGLWRRRLPRRLGGVAAAVRGRDALGHPARDLRLLPGRPAGRRRAVRGQPAARAGHRRRRSPTCCAPFRRNGGQIAFIGLVLLVLHLFWVRIAGLIFMLFFGLSGIPSLRAAALCDAEIRPAAALPGHRHRLRLHPRRRQLRGLGGLDPDAGGPRHLGAGGDHGLASRRCWRTGGRCCSGPG